MNTFFIFSKNFIALFIAIVSLIKILSKNKQKIDMIKNEYHFVKEIYTDFMNKNIILAKFGLEKMIKHKLTCDEVKCIILNKDLYTVLKYLKKGKGKLLFEAKSQKYVQKNKSQLKPIIFYCITVIPVLIYLTNIKYFQTILKGDFKAFTVLFVPIFIYLSIISVINVQSHTAGRIVSDCY